VAVFGKLVKSRKETAICKRGNNTQKIQKDRILKIENNHKTRKQTSNGYKKNVSKLLRDYLPMDREEKNGSSARHSTVRYMVLGVWDSQATGQVQLLPKATVHLRVVANGLVFICFIFIVQFGRT
jgi:hypothetical protein